MNKRHAAGIISACMLCLATMLSCDMYGIVGSIDTSHDSSGQVIEWGTDEEMIAASLEDILPTDNAFSYQIVDFSETSSDDDSFISEGISFDSGFHFINATMCDREAPNSCHTIGSIERMKLDGNGAIQFNRAVTVLGMHISLSRSQIEQLEDLQPEQGSGSLYYLPRFLIHISGLDEFGEVISSVRAIPASADYTGTQVEEDWMWVDTSIIGEVHGLKIEIESPIAGISSILIDNLTISDDFMASDTYFTIALLPDTQKYVEKQEYHEIFYDQTAYLASNNETENIVFVSHLGDIVEHGDNPDEWSVASKAMESLDGVVPYGIVIGNHDFEDEWNNPNMGSPQFLQHFPQSRFSSYPWWISWSPDELSSCQLFETAIGNFLYFHLTVDSPPPTVEWAQGVLDEYPGTPALVTTHAYLRENGRIPVPYLGGMSEGDWDGISADDLFTDFIAPNNQIWMVTCGHISAEHYQVSRNNRGQEVYELLQDYQNREYGGEGFLRLIRFYYEDDLVQVLTYSPWLDMYEIDSDSYFPLEIDFDSRL